MEKRYKTVGIIAIILMAFLLGFLFCRSVSGTEAAADTYVCYIVQAGDTLWDIAEAHSDNNVDLRKLVYEIRKASGLSDADINIGDKLHIPTKYLPEGGEAL